MHTSSGLRSGGKSHAQLPSGGKTKQPAPAVFGPFSAQASSAVVRLSFTSPKSVSVTDWVLWVLAAVENLKQAVPD